METKIVPQEAEADGQHSQTQQPLCMQKEAEQSCDGAATTIGTTLCQLW